MIWNTDGQVSFPTLRTTTLRKVTPHTVTITTRLVCHAHSRLDSDVDSISDTVELAPTEVRMSCRTFHQIGMHKSGADETKCIQQP